MNCVGNLSKMSTVLNSVVQYSLLLGTQKINLNDLLHQKISLTFLEKINCIQCGRAIKKTFQGGFCFPCMRRINECKNCVIFPERCTVEAGTCPQNDWAHAHCHASQIVYLANSSGVKVGITREKNIPHRWIDQGAVNALPIFWAANRYRSGLMEQALAKYVADKTNWRQMLKNNVKEIDLIHERDKLLQMAHDEIQQLIADDNTKLQALTNEAIVKISYPVSSYPQKIVSRSLDKESTISGVLLGIKGQYLILDTGVINVSKFGGYQVEFKCVDAVQA